MTRLYAALAALAALFAGVWGYGRAKGKEGYDRAENNYVRRRSEAVRETHERINNANTSDNLSDGDVLERLRERGRRNSGA
jgi:hypothetical protein